MPALNFLNYQTQFFSGLITLERILRRRNGGKGDEGEGDRTRRRGKGCLR